MTYATINLLHDLLVDHVDYLEDQLQDAERLVTEEIAAHDADAEEGNQEAIGIITAAMEQKQAVSRETTAARRALKDFEAHDWH